MRYSLSILLILLSGLCGYAESVNECTDALVKSTYKSEYFDHVDWHRLPRLLIQGERVVIVARPNTERTLAVNHAGFSDSITLEPLPPPPPSLPTIPPKVPAVTPPPSVSKVEVHFHTNNDDKDA